MNINLNSMSNAFYTMPRSYLVVTGVVVGALAYPLINKISAIALDIFIAFIKYFSDLMNGLNHSTLYVRLHSLTCEDCAAEHRNHMV